MRPWPTSFVRSIAEEPAGGGGEGRPAQAGPIPGRAGAMVRSVLAAARGEGARGRAPGVVLRHALELALEPRIATLPDDHHPAYLHPGRVGLILLRDEGRAEPDLLASAVLLESRDAALRVPLTRIEAELGPEIAGAVARVPRPGSEDLAERLVVLGRDAATAALAERLDHLRHEHLRTPVTPWPELLDETRRIWLPVAEREAPNLARRYRHWLRAFERRL